MSGVGSSRGLSLRARAAISGGLLVGFVYAVSTTIAACSTARPSKELLGQICAAPAYSQCSAEIDLYLSTARHGDRVAVCDYGNGDGNVVLIDSTQTAESACSDGSLGKPTRVVRRVTLP
jgi:hypothetical protein